MAAVAAAVAVALVSTAPLSAPAEGAAGSVPEPAAKRSRARRRNRRHKATGTALPARPDATPAWEAGGIRADGSAASGSALPARPDATPGGGIRAVEALGKPWDGSARPAPARTLLTPRYVPPDTVREEQAPLQHHPQTARPAAVRQLSRQLTMGAEDELHSGALRASRAGTRSAGSDAMDVSDVPGSPDGAEARGEIRAALGLLANPSTIEAGLSRMVQHAHSARAAAL